MSNENFFKHDDKAYAENLNDAILIGNAFNYQVPVNIPEMYSNNHYPSDNLVHKCGVSDVTIVSSSSLSIGDTSITNNSNTSQVLRLRVYPNFNQFYGWKDLGWDGDEGITVDICDAGTTTSLLPSGELTNPDGNNLSGVASLRGLKEYDLLITIPVNGVLNTLSFVFVNNWNSSNRVSASLSTSNVTGLESSLTALSDEITTVSDNIESLMNSEATARSNADNVLHTLLESLVEQNDLTFTQIASVTGTLTNNNNSLKGNFVVKLNYRLSNEGPSLVATNQFREYELDLILLEGATGFVFNFSLDNRGCPYTLTASVGEETRVGTITSVGIGESKTFTF